MAQDPSRQDAAVLVLRLVGPSGSEDQILDGVVAGLQGAVVLDRGPLAGGTGRRVVADVTARGVPVRIGAVAVAAQGGAAIGMLMSKQDEFAALGGTDLAVRAPQRSSTGAHPARRYDVGLAADGRLILVGPSCEAFDEGSSAVTCHPRARWEPWRVD